MNLMKTLSERWKAETPIFWKKVQQLATWVGTAATAVWGANMSMNLMLPEVILTICKYLILASIVSGIQAKLTKVDAPQS